MPTSRDRFARGLLIALGAAAFAALPVVPAGSGPLTDTARVIERARLHEREMRVAKRRAAALPAPQLGVWVQAPAPQAARRLDLMSGDQLSASATKNRAIQVADGSVSYGKVKVSDYVPRGIAYDPVTGLMAIAAVDRVILHEPDRNRSVAIAGPDGGAFSFANDVLFDGNGGLIIVDMGVETTANTPVDGKVWRHVLETGELVEIATGKGLANPKLLAADKGGVIHVIDGGVGDLVSPVFTVRWDVVFRIEGKNLTRVKQVYDDPGIQATAYAIASNGWHWIMNTGELVRFKGSKFEQNCLPPFPLKFGTGVTIDANGIVRVMDGADVVTRDRGIFTITDECVAAGAYDRKLKGARGLAQVPE